MSYTHKILALVSATCILSMQVHGGVRVEIDRIVGRVDGINVTKKMLAQPQITNGAKPYTFEQYAANLLWLQRARDRHIEAPVDDVSRSVSRYKEDNGLAGLPDEEADTLLIGQIGIDFATYREQLSNYFMIESLKSYEFRNRCSIAEFEVRSYYDEHPIVDQAEYRVALVSLTPEQLIEWESGILLTEKLDWDQFDFLKHDQIAPHIQMIYTMDIGSYALTLDAQAQPLLVHLIERKEARLQTLTERYHTIEMALQREKIAKYAAESEQETYRNAVISRLP